MQFLKNHYEKVILSLVLVGLVAAVVVLLINVGTVKTSLKRVEDTLVVQQKPVQLRPREPFIAALQSATNPPALDLGAGHRVLNPYKWVADASGNLIKVEKGDEIGAGALQVVNVINLYYEFSFERVSGTGDNPRYAFSALRGGAADLNDRKRKRTVYVSVGQKSPSFPYVDGDATVTLKEVVGDPAKPDALVLDLERPEEAGGTIEIRVTPTEPYRELMTREADLNYPPEGRNFRSVKVGDSLQLGSDTYKVIAITDKQIILESQTRKRTYIDYTSSAP
jgi:hypothetical protein